MMRENFLEYIYAIITFIICSLIILFINNTFDNSDALLKSDELDLIKDLLKKYKEENNLKSEESQGYEEEEIKNNLNDINIKNRKIDKELLIGNINKLINEDNRISKKKLSKILDKLLEHSFNKKHKEEKILLNIKETKNENNLKKEYNNKDELSVSKELENLNNNLKYVSEFYSFLKEHNKSYKNIKEKIERYENFRISYLEIEKHNAQNNIYKKKLNQFSDYSKKDLEIYFKALMPVPAHIVKKYVKPFNRILKSEVSAKFEKDDNFFENIPINLDYRDQGIVTEPKNQKLCGSCWAFASVGSIESIYAKVNNEKLCLSDQEVVDCSKLSYGCDGGHPLYSYMYVMENGLCLEKDYKYISMENYFCLNFKCNKKIHIEGITEISANDLIYALNLFGPLSINVGVSKDFIKYSQGIFNGSCSQILNHSILLVGYGQEKKQKSHNNKNMQTLKDNLNDSDDDFIYYWVIKNSWGKDWGEKGFMRIIRNKKGNNLFCGIGIEVFSPIL